MSAFRATAVLCCALALVACGNKSPRGNPGASAPAVGSVLPPKGPPAGGTVAVIRGLNFQQGAQVTFGPSAAAAVKFVDTKTLTAVTPPGSAGAVNVVVVNPD